MHILMARGAAEFEALFPGLLDDMVAAGVAKLENQPDSIHFGAAGHVLGTGHTLRHEFTAYVPSRKQLEWQIRRRAAALPNVRDCPPRRQRRRGSATTSAWPSISVTPPHRLALSGPGHNECRRPLRIPDGLIAEKVVVAGVSRTRQAGLGMLFYEDRTWG